MKDSWRFLPEIERQGECRSNHLVRILGDLRHHIFRHGPSCPSDGNMGLERANIDRCDIFLLYDDDVLQDLEQLAVPNIPVLFSSDDQARLQLLCQSLLEVSLQRVDFRSSGSELWIGKPIPCAVSSWDWIMHAPLGKSDPGSALPSVCTIQWQILDHWRNNKSFEGCMVKAEQCPSFVSKEKGPEIHSSAEPPHHPTSLPVLPSKLIVKTARQGPK